MSAVPQKCSPKVIGLTADDPRLAILPESRANRKSFRTRSSVVGSFTIRACVYRHSFTWTKSRLSVEVTSPGSNYSRKRTIFMLDSANLVLWIEITVTYYCGVSIMQRLPDA